MIFLKREGYDYIVNFYRYKLYDKETKNYLVTVDNGNFVFLNVSALRQLKKGKIVDKSLYDVLENRGIIVTQNNFNDIVKKFKKKYEFLANGTSLHIIIPTHRCNLGCVYCFASSCDMKSVSSSSDMNEETALKVVDFIMKSPSSALSFEFQGGEPTITFPLIKKMVMRAKELNKICKKDLRFALVSNFTLLNDEMVDWFIDNGVTFCTSLDGPKFIHDKNRMFLSYDSDGELKNDSVIRVGSYDKVVYWIKRINEKYELKNISLRVNALVTITRASLPYHKEIIDEYLLHNINFINIRPLTQVGRALENKNDIYYSQKEYIEFFNNALNYIEELQKKGVFVEERIRELFVAKTLLNVPLYHTEYDSPCGAATGQIVYYTNGDIYTCNEALGRDEFKLGNVLEDKWQDVFKKSDTAKAILNSMLENNVICDRCPYKPYCSTCMVENYCRDGKFNFYPTKTYKHYETEYHCKRIFDSFIKQLKG